MMQLYVLYDYVQRCEDTLNLKLRYINEISRVSDQSGISQLYIIVNIYKSGRKPLNYYYYNLL